jgi:hypothetical protein
LASGSSFGFDFASESAVLVPHKLPGGAIGGNGFTMEPMAISDRLLADLNFSK